MACWEAGADPEGLPWNYKRQGRIQRVYHGILKGMGGSRGYSMACWEAVKLCGPYGLHGLVYYQWMC